MAVRDFLLLRLPRSAHLSCGGKTSLQSVEKTPKKVKLLINPSAAKFVSMITKGAQT